MLAGRMAAQRKTPAAAAPPPTPSEGPTRHPRLRPPLRCSDSELIERTFTNLALVAMSEGKLHNKENKFLISWGKDNGVSAERMKQLFDVAKADPPEAHPATRDDLELMALMAMADGVLSTGEWHFLLKIAEENWPEAPGTSQDAAGH